MDDLFTAHEPDASTGADTEYHRVIAGLSETQRRAVTHEGGPLIVLAGPGTGKTRVITARVAHMINERGIEPDRIAAVTFTNKAAGELRHRLAGLVGQTQAARVHASTFHSLGFGIVRRFADLLGLPGEPTILDSSQRNRLIRDIIHEERLYRRSLSTGIGAAVDHARACMESLRHLGMDAQAARAWLEGALDSVATCNAEDRDAREAELERFGQAVEVYGRFESRCRELGWVVIDDLIMLPTKLVRSNPQVASIVHHDHRHLVVDEFQDVNLAQIEMIRALCPPSERADVCVVGDDDQSIYGFRGADDRAFAHFAGIWTHAQTVQLTTNYRSARVIVDASNASITRAESRFAPDKEADAHRGDVDGASLELIRMDDDNQAGDAIASMLLQMASAGGEEFSFSSCAVIARSNPFLEQIARTLMLEGIPIDMREKPSPMEDEGARDVFAWARLIEDPDSVPNLQRVLTRPPYRVNPMKLKALFASYRAARSLYEEQADDPDASVRDPGTLIDWVLERSEGEMRDRVEAMRGLLTELGYVAGEQRAVETITEIVKRTGVVHRDLSDARTRARRISAIAAIIKFARTRADRFDAPGDLASMLAYFDDLDDRDQRLGDLPEDVVSAFEEDSPALGEERGAVAMLTAHSSKGLEFDTVFIPRVGQHGFAPSGKGDDPCLPEGVEDRGDDDRDEKARTADEERRVFFVALTRAERRAIIMAKVPKKPTAANYALELRESMGERLLERDVVDVIDEDRAGDAVSRLSAEFKAISRVRDAFDQAEREARRDAASAIDAHELGEIGRDELQDRMRAASDRAAAVHEVLRTGQMPAWATDEQTRGYAQQLLEVLEQQDAPGTEAPLYPGLRSPLSLSFSKISSYLHCPRCFLAQSVLKLHQDDDAQRVLGVAVHKGLELFYKDWMRADAEGGDRPGYTELRKLTRGVYKHQWPREREIDQGRLEQLDAILDVYWHQMHRDDAHILEIEREIEMPYACDGVTHTMRAKIDRVDASGDGWRVVDYKTGYPSKKLTEPKKTDQQMGIYTMVLEHAMGQPGPGSVCEYWCLQDGSVGTIGFDALDMKKIRASIDKAIRGMIAGDWSRSNACVRERGNDSPCMILEAPGMVFSDRDEGENNPN
ncbi:MAG: ATP-dependent helicase [Phycisphaerales bacterium JB052]